MARLHMHTHRIHSHITAPLFHGMRPAKRCPFGLLYLARSELLSREAEPSGREYFHSSMDSDPITLQSSGLYNRLRLGTC
jgi:hypothetical protein